MAVTLSPIGNGFQFFSVGGLPLSGGLLYTYQAGTSTPLTSYTDSAGATPNTNPIVLDSGGRPPAEIWLTTGSAYKFVLTDSLSTPIGPALDNISGMASLNNATLTGNTVIGTTGNTLNVANSALVVSSGNTAVGGDLSIAGNTSLGNAGADLITVNAATIAAPNNPTVSGNWTFSGNISAANVTASGNATLGDAAADVVTVNGTASFPLALSTHSFGINVGNASRATSTTLDYYDEGNWTPGMELGGATTGWSFAGSAGKWTRIGRLVSCSYHLVVTTKGSATGTCKMSGLPFTSLNDGGNLSALGMGGPVLEFSGLLTNWISIGARIDQTGGTTLAKIFGTTAAAAASTQLTDAAFQAGAYLRGTFTYMTET